MMEAATGRKHAVMGNILSPLGFGNAISPHIKITNHCGWGYYDLYNNDKIVNVSNMTTGGEQ